MRKKELINLLYELAESGGGGIDSFGDRAGGFGGAEMEKLVGAAEVAAWGVWSKE